MSFVVPEGPAGVPTVSLHNVLLGGVRLNQSRYASVPCRDAPVYAKIASINGTACFSADTSTANFGIALNPVYANSTLRRAFLYRLSEATRFFGALTSPTGSVHPYFIVFPDITTTTLGTELLLNQLNWFDAATASLDFYFVLLNSDVGAWTEVLVTYKLVLGGSITVDTRTKTLWNAGPDEVTQAVDGVFLALIVLQFVELAVYISLSAWKLLSLYRRSGGTAVWSQLRGLLLPGLGVALVFAIDVATVGLMLASHLGIVHQRSLVAAVQEHIAAASWSGATYESDTVMMHEAISDVATSQAYLESLAIALVIFAALKFIAVCSAPFAVSSRLGNVQRAFARAVPDLFSAGVLVALAMATFGLIGQILYAAAVPDWSTSLGTGLSLFRAFNGEGSTDAMYASSPVATSIFYPAIYIVLQSSLLALFFAILADSFSSVRETSTGASSSRELLVARDAATPRGADADAANPVTSAAPAARPAQGFPVAVKAPPLELDSPPVKAIELSPPAAPAAVAATANSTAAVVDVPLASVAATVSVASVHISDAAGHTIVAPVQPGPVAADGYPVGSVGGAVIRSNYSSTAPPETPSSSDA